MSVQTAVPLPPYPTQWWDSGIHYPEKGVFCVVISQIQGKTSAKPTCKSPCSTAFLEAACHRPPPCPIPT